MARTRKIALDRWDATIAINPQKNIGAAIEGPPTGHIATIARFGSKTHQKAHCQGKSLSISNFSCFLITSIVPAPIYIPVLASKIWLIKTFGGRSVGLRKKISFPSYSPFLASPSSPCGVEGRQPVYVTWGQ
ncbi:MAG: hypothetical protein KDD90_10920 [Sphingomonadaceae bacterium]|nr:hypothetical protein [Sphingomonadaceae bacterium]